MKTIEKEELGTLIPHKGKMFLIDRLVDYNVENWTVTSETDITSDFMFFDSEKGGVPDYVIFELAAQTVSSMTGLYAREKKLPPNMGFILSLSRLNFDVNFIKSGSTVRINAERESQMGNVYSFNTEFLVDGQHIGKGKITAMEVQDGK